jgi:LysM repeat protein
MRKLLTLLIALGMLLSLQISFVGAQGPHVVQAGETAQTIADEYGVTVEALLRANNLRSPDQVVEGLTLEIPLAEEPASEPAPPDGRADQPADTPAEQPVEEPADTRADQPAPADRPAGQPDVRSGEPITKPADDVGVAAWISPGSGSTDVFVQNADANTGNPAIDAVAEYIGAPCSAGACTATKNIKPLAAQPFLASAAPVGMAGRGL